MMQFNSSANVFQSTLSVRRATHAVPVNAVQCVISIHALRKESDTADTPCDTRHDISIHALRKESDSKHVFSRNLRFTFQSTLSVRRAT